MRRLEQIWERWGAWFLLGLLAASLVPILLLGRYDWASADDFCYGILPRLALEQGESFWAAVARTVSSYYRTWQGSFMSLLLMSLTPVAFSEYAYWITPAVMLGSLCLGTFKLTDTLVRRVFCRGESKNWKLTVEIAAPLLLMSIQCAPWPKDSFFWWNGAVYYTFTYGIMLLLVERLFALRCAGTRRKKLWAVLPALPAALLVGGSNYVCALLAVLLTALFMLDFLLRDRPRLAWAAWPALVLFGSFAASVLAPGNQFRQATLAPPIGVWEAVVKSILKAREDCLSWPNWPIVLGFVLMIPALWRLTEGVKFRFPLPAGFSVFSFLLFAAENAPHFYAVDSAGPGRLRSIVFYSFFWLVLSNLWYWLGWLRRVLPAPEGRRQALRRAARGGMLLTLAALVGTTLFYRYLPGFTSMRCARALADGSAAAYFAQQEARLTQLRDPAARNVVLPPIETRPPLLYNGDAGADPLNWRNNVMRVFYGKDSLTVARTTPPG